jgi:hypothetical protein
VLRGWFSRKTEPLSGAPPVRRLKTYSAQSGYVYQYYYEGHRRNAEFVFSVSADRKSWAPTRVLLSEEALRDWEASRERTLTSTERYALAKMALFQAFDERPAPSLIKEDIHVRPSDIDGILETLGL